jgi:hypothetical protein
MQSVEIFFLALVVGAFIVFGVTLAGASLKTRPRR